MKLTSIKKQKIISKSIQFHKAHNILKYLIYIFSLTLLFSCTSKVEESEIDKKAAQLNEEALNLYQNFILNKDSVLKAITLLDKAIEIEPNYFVAFHNKIAFQIKLGQVEEAINTCKRIEKLRPNSEETKVMIGILHYSNGDTISANKKYNEANLLCQKKLDTLSNESEEEFRIKTNKAIVLKFLNREKEANEIFRSVDVNKSYLDEAQREFMQEAINDFIKYTPEELEQMYFGSRSNK